MKKSIGLVLSIALLLAVTMGVVAVQADSVIIPDGDYTIVNNGVYQLSSGYSGNITVSNAVYEVTVTDSVYKSYHTETAIIIEGGRTGALELTIENLNINAGLADVDTQPHLSGIDFGEAGNYAHKLYISGTCNIEGGFSGQAGINVPAGTELTIDKTEGLTDEEAVLTAAGGRYGAGIGGSIEESGGTINIVGGTVNATSEGFAAGIGGGLLGSGGNINISGGIITASDEGSYGAAIGGGWEGTGGNISISGGRVRAIGTYGGAGIGGGRESYTDKEGDADGGNITISGGEVIATVQGPGAAIGGGHGGSAGNIIITGGTVSATAFSGAGIGNGMDGAGGIISISGGIIDVVSNYGGAGIGGGGSGTAGTVIISGGQVTVESTSGYNAGIGGGSGEAGGTIIISGGTVTVTVSDSGAGIGGGYMGEGGSITITGGVITAVGGNSAAGIGGGNNGNGGTVTISGGDVRAVGGSNAAGIGGGRNGEGAAVTILNTPSVVAAASNSGGSLYPAKPIGNGSSWAELDPGTLKDSNGSDLSYFVFDTAPVADVKIKIEGAGSLDGEYSTGEEGIFRIFVPYEPEDSYSYIMSKAGYSAVEGSGVFTTSSNINVEMTLDDTKPDISGVTPEVVKAGGNVTVTCTDYGIYGTVYLAAKTETTYTSKAQLEASYIEKLEAAGSVSIESTGLAEGYYQVYLVDSAENVSVPEDIFVDNSKPVAASKDITLSDITYSSIRLTWNEAADNFTDVDNLEYIIYKSLSNNMDSVESIETNGTVAANVNISGSTGYTVAGLNDETTYYLNIIVRDQAGNKTFYNSASAKTLKEPSGSRRSRTPSPIVASKIDIPVIDLIGASGAMKEVKTELATLIIPSNMLTADMLGNAQTVQILVGKADTSKLSAELQTQIGSRPVIELALKLDGRTLDWSNPDAPVTVSIPYVPTAEELKNPENITVWYIDGAGNAVAVPSGRYNSATGRVTFTTTHFSSYAVVYVEKTFNDLYSYDWAKKQIEILAAKGIMTGRSDNSFVPSAGITRAEYIGALVRILGVTAKADSSFNDVKTGDSYYNEIAIAKKLGITNGTGSNNFKPEAAITRQDMLVLTERALRSLNKLHKTGTMTDLEQFTDKAQLNDYAVGSIASLVAEGLIEGSNGKLNVEADTTRAEAAVFLYRIYNIK